MKLHHLTEKDPATRRGVCSVDGDVRIQRSGTGWVCGAKHNATARASKARRPDRDKASRTEHTLEWQDGVLRSGLCTKCGPVDIVPVGRGYMCAPRAKELGRVNHQDKPATYCDACKLLDGSVVWLSAEGCPRCIETDLNAMFAQEAADDRLYGDLHEEFADGFSIVGVNADPYAMPELENAVVGWKTIG
jgi:hypothetical protein